jgi:hypothetical protein
VIFLPTITPDNRELLYVTLFSFPFSEIDGDDFVAQCFAFLTAGFETSSTTMTLILHELALQPDIQRRLRAETTQVLDKHNHEVTYDGLQEMTYLDMVISGVFSCIFIQSSRKVHY